MAERKHTTADVARARGVSVGSVRRWIKNGCPATKQGRSWKLKLSEVETWLDETNRDGEHGGDRSGSLLDADAQEAWRRARARKTQAQADQAELELRVRRGELVEIEEVVHAMRTVITQARTQIMALPSRLSEQLEGLEAGSIYEAIQAEAEAVLERLEMGLRKATG